MLYYSWHVLRYSPDLALIFTCTRFHFSVWNGDHTGTGHRLCHDWDVRCAGRDWRWCLPSYHHSAVCRWIDRSASG